MGLRILISVVGLMLAACSNHNDQPTVSLPDFGSGARHVAISGDTAGDGLALINPDGSAYLLLGNDSNAASTVVYRRSAGKTRWSRVPALAQSPTVTLQLNEADAATAVALPSAATTLRVPINGLITSFTLQPDGKISAASGGCQISGTLKSVGGQVSSQLSLHFDQCGSITGAYGGVAFVDTDAPNAAAHIVVDNGSSIQDFYVYSN